MQVGDLIKERDFPELGVIIEIKDLKTERPYAILCTNGEVGWYAETDIQKCEVVNEGW